MCKKESDSGKKKERYTEVEREGVTKGYRESNRRRGVQRLRERGKKRGRDKKRAQEGERNGDEEKRKRRCLEMAKENLCTD